ncbi:hypothetical protein [Paenibacillus antarcticus]|nr:hypothetical protein [Paenibacillus antarcticus]
MLIVKKNMAETLGEHFVAQVKAIHSTEITNIKVYARHNIEKTELRIEEEMLEIEVIKFPRCLNIESCLYYATQTAAILMSCLM